MMKNNLLRCVIKLAFVLVTTIATQAAAAKKVALVLGNSAYTGRGALDDAANDAAAISQSLQRLGFDVHAGLEMTTDAMRTAVRSFSRDLAGADIALFYYAGHAVQVDGKNYLLPVDFDFETSTKLFDNGKKVSVASMLEFDTLRLDLILEQMQSNAKANVIFLDACRDNPFATALATGGTKTRSIGNSGTGLAPIETNAGALIGFSTSPGAVSYEGLGDHSPFAEALLTHLETPGLEINALMTRVRADVFNATGELQRPWTNTSLIQDVYLSAPKADSPAPKSEPVPDVVAKTKPQPDPPVLIEDGTVTEFQAALNRVFPGSVVEPLDDGDPAIWFDVGDTETAGYFYDCNDAKTQCLNVQLSVLYDFGGDFPHEKILRWNRATEFARAFIDEEGDPGIEFDYNLYHAVSQANVEATLAAWHDAVRDFELFIDW